MQYQAPPRTPVRIAFVIKEQLQIISHIIYIVYIQNQNPRCIK